MITITNAEAALKDFYIDAVTSQLNDKISPFFTAIEKNTACVYGKNTKVIVCSEFANNVVAGDEDGNLPDTSANNYYEISVPLKNLYGTIEISDKAIRAASGQSDGFINLLNAEMEGLVVSAKDYFERMLFSDGNGTMGAAITKNSNTEYKVSNVRRFKQGQRVDFYGGGTYLSRNNLVTGVNYATSVISLESEITSTALGNFIMSGSRGKELIGLDGIFDQGELYGYDTEDTPYFKPTTFDAADTLSLEEIEGLIDNIEELHGKKPNMLLCSFKTRREIAALMQENNYTVNTTVLNGGYTAITINGVPLVPARYCPEDRLYILNTDDFMLVQLCDWEWMEDEDGKILKQVPGKASFSATLVKYAELVCKKPCAQTVYYW